MMAKRGRNAKKAGKTGGKRRALYGAVVLFVGCCCATVLFIPDETSPPNPLSAGGEGEQVVVTDVPTEDVGAVMTTLPTFDPVSLTEVNVSGPGYVHKDDWGDEWAFTVDEGVIQCRDSMAVVFVTGGRVYAMNGIAMSWYPELPEIREIWRDDPTGTFPKVDISPFTELGMGLCDE